MLSRLILISTFLLSLTRTIHAAPNVTTLLSGTFEFQNDTFNDLTQDIDSRFSIQADVLGESLNEVSTAMNLLGAIRSLTEKAWFGTFDDPLVWSLQPWNDVSVVASPVPSLVSTFQRRYAIWGLYIAICKMVEDGAKSTIYTISWNASPVGVVAVSTSISGDLLELIHRHPALNGTMSLKTMDHNSTLPSSDVNDLADPSDLSLSVVYVERGRAITAKRMYGVLAKALVSAAGEPKDDQAQSEVVTKVGYQEWLQIIIRGTVSRRSAILTNHRLVEAIWMLAKWLTANGMRREYTVIVRIGNKLRGVLHGSTGRPPTYGAASDEVLETQ